MGRWKQIQETNATSTTVRARRGRPPQAAPKAGLWVGLNGRVFVTWTWHRKPYRISLGKMGESAAKACLGSVQSALATGVWPEWAAQSSAVHRYVSDRSGPRPLAVSGWSPTESRDAALLAEWQRSLLGEIGKKDTACHVSVLREFAASLDGSELLTATKSQISRHLEAVLYGRQTVGTAGRLLSLFQPGDTATIAEMRARLVAAGVGQNDRGELGRLHSAVHDRPDLFRRTERGTYQFLEPTEKPRSKATRNRHLVCIRKFFAWSTVRGYLPHSPATGLKALPEDVSPEIVWCDRTERDRIVKAADKLGHGLPVRIAFWSGLRRGEIARLRKRDIDLTSGWIAVGRDRATQTKTRTARQIPIADALRSVLELATKKARTEILFDWNEDIESRARSILDEIRAEIPELAGKISWNVWRHTFCSLLAQTGKVSIDQIAAISGHTPEVCRRHYAHLIPRDRGAVGIDLL